MTVAILYSKLTNFGNYYILQIMIYSSLIAVCLLFVTVLEPLVSSEEETTSSSSPTSQPNGYSLTTQSYTDYLRPNFPLNGTINWKHLSPSQQAKTHFSPRHSHATAVFPCPFEERDTQCIWVTGGRTEPYRTFNLRTEDRTADVWYSKDGIEWNQVMELDGDFLLGIGNDDAKPRSTVAPWYSRYGHSMDAIDTDGDGEKDILVLMGGFTPIPMNDVWISSNGLSWFFERNAAWTERAYHATAVFDGELFVMGGTPMSNDVWSGRFVRNNDERAGYRIDWKRRVANGKAPWAPR